MKRPLKPLEPRNLESGDPRCRRPRRVNHHFNWAAWDAGYGIAPTCPRRKRRRSSTFVAKRLLKRYGSGLCQTDERLYWATERRYHEYPYNRLGRKRARRSA